MPLGLTVSDVFLVVVWLLVGVATVATLHKRFPDEFERFTSGSLENTAMIAFFWPAALVWLVVLERRAKRPPGGGR